jgi:hypothetical protein
LRISASLTGSLVELPRRGVFSEMTGLVPFSEVEWLIVRDVY